MELLSKLKYAFLYVILVIFLGVAGFMAIEKWNFIDSLYMTIITLATVGFSEVHKLSYYGKIFVIVLILSGIGVATYFITLITRFIVEGHFRNLFRRKKMEEILKSMTNHYIVCGSGKIAEEAIKEIRKKDKSIIHIDGTDEESDYTVFDNKYIKIYGDPTDDKVLERAKIRKAKALIVATDNEANNLYITLSARQVNSELYIVALAEKESSIDKFRKAGADRVISIFGIGGKRMASAVLRPSVVDFLEIAMYGEDFQLQMEEIEVKKDSFLDGKMLKESNIRQKSGAIVLSIRRENKLIINPEPDFKIVNKDRLIVLGSLEQLKKISILADNSQKNN